MKIKSKNNIETLKEYSENHFQNLVTSQIKKFTARFNKNFKIHASPLNFAKEERERIHLELTKLFNSNLSLTKDYFEVQNIKEKDKNKTFAEVIEKYCKGSKDEQKLLVEFVAKVIGLHKILKFLSNKKFLSKEETDPQRKLQTETIDQPQGFNQSDEKKDYEFSIVRKVLVLSYLMEDYLDKDVMPDKTTIAKFIESLIYENPKSGKIENSNTYKKVKPLFFNTGKANNKDLVFVKKIFADLGLVGLVEKIDSELKIKRPKQ